MFMLEEIAKNKMIACTFCNFFSNTKMKCIFFMIKFPKKIKIKIHDTASVDWRCEILQRV